MGVEGRSSRRQDTFSLLLPSPFQRVSAVNSAYLSRFPASMKAFLSSQKASIRVSVVGCVVSGLASFPHFV